MSIDSILYLFNQTVSGCAQRDLKAELNKCFDRDGVWDVPTPTCGADLERFDFKVRQRLFDWYLMKGEYEAARFCIDALKSDPESYWAARYVWV